VTKGRFLNQKLGKRTDRKSQLLKARLKAQRLTTRLKQRIKVAYSNGPSR